MKFESKRGQNERKTCFAIRKNIYFLQLFFFGWSLGFAFQKRFVKLEKGTPITFQITQNEEIFKKCFHPRDLFT
jgi:hypothetical protein